MNGKKLRLCARTKRSWNKPRELVKHDWDFSDCPQEELRTCFRYEYCRESKIREVIHWFRRNQDYCQSLLDAADKILERKQSAAESFTPDEMPLLEVVNVLLWLNFECFGYVSEFPDIPWLDLRKELRADYLKDIKDSADDNAAAGGVSIALVEKEQNVEWQRWKELRELRHPGSIYGWFSIHPCFNKHKIAKQFVRQLAGILKANPRLFSTRPGGRGGPADALNQLGAYRILCGRSPKRAANFVEWWKRSNGKTFPFYCKGNAWYRARDGALAHIEDFNGIAADFFSCLRSHK